MKLFREKKGEFSEGGGCAYEYYSEHREGGHTVIREWAPNAERMYLLCEKSGWKPSGDFSFSRINDYGDWEIRVPAEEFGHDDYYKLLIEWQGGSGERLPAYARRVVQDPETYIFSGRIWLPEREYPWENDFTPADEPPVIYEAHVGMAREHGGIGTYLEFADRILPKIKADGFNSLQLMALMEHPYYGSFGYQVSNFYAPSSRYGTPDELKLLVDRCHEYGIRVIMDLVHSHAVKNEVEGIGLQDGTEYLYFHEGGRGSHPAWDSRCFDYGKDGVLNFLLSNCAYWLKEYRLDGFRFDGVTSMLYHDHGLGASFDHYDKYYGPNTDEDALVYLMLANDLIHRIKPGAVTIAEDMSGLPGIAAPIEDGGCGFDYRLAMGIPDFWIKLLKEEKDEAWDMGRIWGTLNNRRFSERHIAYSESHDQALVGDKTLIFRMMDAEMYTGMSLASTSPVVERGMALIKIINLLTFSAAGDGWMNFMGNEFGHPEWIDFPREGNGWSYHYARRQWSLSENQDLRYHSLGLFTSDMIAVCGSSLGSSGTELYLCNNGDKVLCYGRGGLIYIVNTDPKRSYTDYGIELPEGRYSLLLCTDWKKYDGNGRIPEELVLSAAVQPGGRCMLTPYLPSRTALVFGRKDDEDEGDIR